MRAMLAAAMTAAGAGAAPLDLGLTTIDLAGEADRQVVVDREEGQYLGHVTTVLLEDGRTMIAVYPKGHGRGAIVMKRSADGGRTWSDRLPVPASWATSREVPTIHRVVDAKGVKRLIVWSGLHPARLASSADDGATWTELQPAGDWGGIVVMGFVEPLKTPGRHLAMFHDDGRFFAEKPVKGAGFTLYSTVSGDGGLTWSKPSAVWNGSEINLCEPGCIRSPDGRRLAVLLRENARRKGSHLIVSDDEGATWSKPAEMPMARTGDRHTLKATPDGRIICVFRAFTPAAKGKNFGASEDVDKAGIGSPFEGDCVAWVGTWNDLVTGAPGQYYVRLLDNRKGWDTTYPGVEVLPDGTVVVTTYGTWDAGHAPYIRSTRFTLKELDARAAGTAPRRP